MSKESSQQAERPTRNVEILAFGMLTPVGADAGMTAASVRSGISAYESSSVMNKQFNPMTMALVPEEALPPLNEELLELSLTSRQQRLLRLSTPALQQLAEVITKPIPLLLCGPEKMPGRRSVISDKTLQQMATQTGVEFDLENSYVFPQGRAAGLYALESAIYMLESGQFEQVIIGGADSYLDLYLLATLDADDRILAEGIMDGFAPGEAAAFMMIKLADENSKLKITPPGIADEPGHRYSEEPYKGEGLANAVTEALSTGTREKIKTVFASFNGENFGAKEWSVAAIRNQQQLDPDFSIIHPAEYYGDIGAATVPVLLALAHIGITEGYYQKPALVWASSEFEQRAASCIE